MTQAEFERLVEKVIAEIPDQFSDRFENLVFVVERLPGCELLAEAGLDVHEELLGFYRGIPLDERSHDMTMQEPDMIYLFQQAIEIEAAACNLAIEQVVRETVAHEVAHYFGFSEEYLEHFEDLWAKGQA